MQFLYISLKKIWIGHPKPSLNLRAHMSLCSFFPITLLHVLKLVFFLFRAQGNISQSSGEFALGASASDYSVSATASKTTPHLSSG
jgi:hypothetical protein